jgi:uncharacterized SAM-binding protein YcdF (DUF218 family)
LRRSFFNFLLFLAGLAFGGWLAGLFVFAAQITAFDEPAIDAALPPTEAIVVLTGGSERVSTGLELLMASKGKKLLISGVPQGLNLNHILVKHSVTPELRDCCVFLGHAADNTVGNAEETRVWVEAEKFHSLRLVTAHYHMPRSLLIFKKALPGIEIVPHPVAPDRVKLTDWWLRPGTASLLITEYNKYLFELGREWVEARR